MSNILVINASGQETRVALIEQGTISEYYLERKNEKGIVGNIYKGKVVRVLPGMQAAFVDIGLDKAAFLYVGDIVSDPTFPGFSEEMDIKAGSVEGDPLEAEEDLPEPAEVPAAAETPQQEPLPGTAEEKIAIAQAQEAAPDAPPPPDAGARGIPAEQRPAAREGRRGRRRGGRGRRRGAAEGPRPAGEQQKGPPERRSEGGRGFQGQERRGGNGAEKRNGGKR